ncbi:hypothetical protein L6164_004895 [Bauhinia variegata]|uniref:Uncharacterized protein n=1 Tax=Bauhinia variegata TaxID=167791 RepID=A0ACB9PNY0_BAUVA|nr:hypothetical protein L6164_004895 [Bauhinia variegata]
MQKALTFAPNFGPLTPSKNISQSTSFPPNFTASPASTRLSQIKATSVNYNSPISVFPAEACETVGGEACLAYIYPEARLEPQARSATPPISTENVEREYLEYNDAKTVFRGDACDDLGGIFCEHDYQRSVH